MKFQVNFFKQIAKNGRKNNQKIIEHYLAAIDRYKDFEFFIVLLLLHVQWN